MPKHEAQVLIGEQIKKAIDIGPTMDAILAGTYESKYPTHELEKLIEKLKTGSYDFDQTPFDEIWDSLKEERNALAAIFIEEIWKEGEEERKDTENEIATRESDFDLPEEFSIAIQGAFSRGVSQYARKMRDRTTHDLSLEGETPLDKAYLQFKTIFAFGKAAKIPRYDNEWVYIERGIGTATDVTWGLIDLVPRLAKEKGLALTEAQVAATIRSAYGPVVAQFASMNIEVAIPLLSQLKDWGMQNNRAVPGLSTAMFDLVLIRDGEYKVTINHDKLLKMKDIDGNLLLKKEPGTDTTMCPARQGNDVVRKYFDWNLEIAKKYYLPNILAMK